MLNLYCLLLITVYYGATSNWNVLEWKSKNQNDVISLCSEYSNIAHEMSLLLLLFLMMKSNIQKIKSKRHIHLFVITWFGHSLSNNIFYELIELLRFGFFLRRSIKQALINHLCGQWLLTFSMLGLVWWVYMNIQSNPTLKWCPNNIQWCFLQPPVFLYDTINSKWFDGCNMHRLNG